MFRLLLICILAGPALWAQGIAITADAGVGGMVISPSTELRVTIAKLDSRPFVGRIHVELGNKDMLRAGRRGGRGGFGFMSDVTVVQDINLEEGLMQRVVRLDVPVANALSATVTLERQVSGNYHEPVAVAEVQMPARNDPGKIVGFVSAARLGLARPYMFFDLVEIPVNELPESWKALAGFDAIILNDDRLTRAQSNALIDYVAMGGTLILSPRGPASFNPETPAGSLLKIPATTSPRRVALGDYPELLKLPRLGSGEARGNANAVPHESEEEASQPDATSGVRPSSGDQQFQYWPDAGRAVPVPDALGLASSAPVGAGNVVLLHVNLSEFPFSVDTMISHANINVVNLALTGVVDRLGRTPYSSTGNKNVQEAIDIAGRRIPGREAMTLLLLLYVSIAGVGMFLLARRLKRPELYPAALMLAALLSVGIVFSFGELFKRSGDRARVVRVLVSDDTTGRAGMFTFGCSYVVSGNNLSFVQARDSLFVPLNTEARIARPGGMPDQVPDYETRFASTETHTKLAGLDRWQNVFYMHRHPAAPDDLKLRVDSLQGAYKVTNLSRHKLHGVMLLVPTGAAGGERCEWHYQAALEPDDNATFSSSTVMAREIATLEAALRADSPSPETFEVFAEVLNIHPAQRLTRHLNLNQVEGGLWNAGLLPGEGEYLLICLLPPDALKADTLGAQDAEADQINQVNVWVVRGSLAVR